MLFMLPAANILEKQGRVCAHRFTPTSREELRKLTQLVPRLRELSIQLIISSDLDAQSADALARRLNVGFEEWPSLRRINAGKLHGTPASQFSKLYDSIQAPEVPVKGGDSHASFGKRMAAARDRLALAQPNTLVVADERVLSHLTGASGAERYHVYQCEVLSASSADKTEAVHASAASSGRS
jgi:broad specificity phosphatase PhoE